MRLVHFGVRSGICHYTFCRLSFVFIQIPGGSFIFDIFLVPVGPVPDLQTHVGEPPQLVQAGIFQSLHKHRAFVVRSSAVPLYRSAAHRTGQRARASGTSVHTIITFVKNKMTYTLQPTN